MSRLARCAAAVLAVAVLPSCGSAQPTQAARDGPVRLASYDFQENQILVEVYAEGVRRAGLTVSVQHGIGPREIVAPALEQGVVDVVVDYLGTALVFASPPGSELPESPDEMQALLEDTMGDRGVAVLEAARAEDQNGFAVTTAFAAAQGVGTLTELVPLAPELVFGGPPECPDRPLCLPGLEEVYGLEFGEFRDDGLTAGDGGGPDSRADRRRPPGDDRRPAGDRPDHGAHRRSRAPAARERRPPRPRRGGGAVGRNA